MMAVYIQNRQTGTINGIFGMNLRELYELDKNLMYAMCVNDKTLTLSHVSDWNRILEEAIHHTLPSPNDGVEPPRVLEEPDYAWKLYVSFLMNRDGKETKL